MSPNCREHRTKRLPPWAESQGVARVTCAHAHAELEAAGVEVLCDVHRIPEMNYAFCHFRGPDGRVYGINEQS